ncbi:hypothetical protein [Streptomyces sp. NPDC096323]|uniref:hypothetical protein n=1 Tax=Streptomyces sp. NPDC096323 TaxID=3155822 RepID=UPI00331A6568
MDDRAFRLPSNTDCSSKTAIFWCTKFIGIDMWATVRISVISAWACRLAWQLISVDGSGPHATGLPARPDLPGAAEGVVGEVQAGHGRLDRVVSDVGGLQARTGGCAQASNMRGLLP